MALFGLPPFATELPTETVISAFSSLADAPAVEDSGLVGALVLPGPVRATLLDGVPARDGEPLVVAFLFFSGKGWATRRLRELRSAASREGELGMMEWIVVDGKGGIFDDDQMAGSNGGG